MKPSIFVAAAFVMSVASVHAQDSLVGKYTGTFEVASNSRQAVGGIITRGLEVNIEKVENGRVTGTATPNYAAGSGCGGAYPFEGSLKENQLVIRARKGGANEDCSLFLRLTAEGNKLTGTTGTGGRRVELSK